VKRRTLARVGCGGLSTRRCAYLLYPAFRRLRQQRMFVVLICCLFWAAHGGWRRKVAARALAALIAKRLKFCARRHGSSRRMDKAPGRRLASCVISGRHRRSVRFSTWRTAALARCLPAFLMPRARRTSGAVCISGRHKSNEDGASCGCATPSHLVAKWRRGDVTASERSPIISFCLHLALSGRNVGCELGRNC